MWQPTLVVMAAGIGRRYGGLKQMDPVGPSGEIIIDYSIYDALKDGFGKVVCVITEEIEEAFRERVGKTIEKRCETAYVLQKLEDVPAGFQVPPGRQKPWGTGHATLCCQDEVHSPFAVINADDFYGRSAFQTLANYLRGAQDRGNVYDYCMVGYVLENTLTEYGHVARGVCTVNQKGYLVEIHERTHIERFGEIVKYTEDGEHWVKIPKASPVSMNLWGFTPSLFSELEARFLRFLQENSDNILEAEYFLPEVVGALIQEKKARVKVLPTDEQWFGITYQQAKSRVKQAIRDLIRRGVYPENLWADVR
jgi:bifunctional N-acetylglucosamine-1-phosphate-uridyltransferase/glucosamine-1-phosphate-acetyltransferase GlmU-like protein